MARSFGSRTVLTICVVLALLLAGFAVVQYRWSTRIAAADLQREKEHLNSAASLFASEYNSIAGQAMVFLQNDTWNALQSGARLASLPNLIDELYYLEIPPQGPPKTRRLTADGLFASSPLPVWMANPRCSELALEEPAALIAPVYDMARTESHGAAGTHIMKTFRWRPDRCFIARINQAYLRGALLPQLIAQSFGATASREYDFAVVALNRPRVALYGRLPDSRSGADLQKQFFPIPAPLPISEAAALASSTGAKAVFLQHVETVDIRGGTSAQPGAPHLFGPAMWELEVARKGLPLTAAFERTHRLDLLLSLGVEALLLAAIVFLVIAARRMQRLADQKMQFVAGVSHELRTPVSAIAMLSRNQADGLVAGAAKVQQYGELIHQQSRRLNEMVEQTLQYAGIHSGLRRPLKQQVDICNVIEEAVDARRAELARCGFDVQLALSPDIPLVKGDAKLLRTAFDNLLSNAEKYADGGRWVRISADYSAPEKEVRISVEDRGAGIDAADQTEIFEPFCRGRAAIEAQIPGSGLGLSLVRSAAEVHRGSVTLVSEPGRGSTFTMHLPV